MILEHQLLELGAMQHLQKDIYSTITGHVVRRLGKGLFCWVLAAALLTASGLAISTKTWAGNDPSTATAERQLILQDIVIEGTDRTPLSTVLLYLPVQPGQAIDQQTLIGAVAELRDSALFKSLDYYTRPGAERGHLILVLDVEEHGFNLRLGTGNTDLDGWYIVPIMVAYDNALGKGGRLDLQWRFGFRHNGTLLTYARPRAGSGRDYWGTRFFYHLDTDRPYFADGVEYRHYVDRTGLSGVYGRRLTEAWTFEMGLVLETIGADSTSTAVLETSGGEIDVDEDIPYEDLLPEIQAGVGDDYRAIVEMDLQHDTRSKRLRAGTPVGGLWGRVKTQFVWQGDKSHLGLQTDLRAYQEMPGGVLAARLRGAVVGCEAVFYDRLYLGGMYTVRGFPTHSLSAPGGDTWLFSSSLEYRSRILGQGDKTRLAGLFFMDAGVSGRSGEGSFSGMSVGAGYGLRLRVKWLGWLGLDVGFPITERPTESRFQVNASIGWSF